MLNEEDNSSVRMMKSQINAWNARAKLAERQGNPQLLQKALKYKSKYEGELAALKQFEAQCEEHDGIQLLNSDQVEDQGCPWCFMFEKTSTSSNYYIEDS